MEERVRLFIALKPPNEWVEVFRQVQRELSATLSSPAIRWVSPEQMHITLRFLGGVPVGQIAKLTEAIDTVASRKPGFALELGGLGCFPSPRRARVLWLGIGGHIEEVATLSNELNNETREMGVKPEDRPFKPHLTLARIREHPPAVRDQLSELLRSYRSAAAGWSVGEILLMRSKLSGTGAVYDMVSASKLRAG